MSGAFECDMEAARRYDTSSRRRRRAPLLRLPPGLFADTILCALQRAEAERARDRRLRASPALLLPAPAALFHVVSPPRCAARRGDGE